MGHELLLAEELLLLSLGEKGTTQTSASLDAGLAGALLLELIELRALRLDDGGKIVPGEARPDDPLLAEAVQVVSSSERARDVGHWVGKLPTKLKPLRRRVAMRLVERGVLGEDRKELLGVTVSHRYPEKDPRLEQDLRARLLTTLTGAGEPGPRDAQLIGLLRAYGLIAKAVPREHRKEARQRAKQIAETGPANSAVHRELMDAQTAIMAATAVAVAVSADGGGG